MSATTDPPQLQRGLTRGGILALLLCTLVGIDGLGTLSSTGGAGLTWLLFCAVFFSVPSSLVLAELGSCHPQEGGPYRWSAGAFGRLVGTTSNFMYWITNPVWFGGALVATAQEGVAGLCLGHPLGRVATYASGVLFIWAGVAASIASIRIGVKVAAAGAVARFLLLISFVVLVIARLVSTGTAQIGVGDFRPRYASFVALVPVILFSLVGYELPSTAGGEMDNPQADVPRAVSRSLVLSTLLYAVPTLGIILVLPTDSIQNISGFVDAIAQTLPATHDAPAHALLHALTIVLGLSVALVAFTSGVAWLMGSDRALAVSCGDGAGPAALGAFSPRFGTPIRVNLLSGTISTIVFVMVETITSGSAAKFFSVALNLAISTTVMSYLSIFPAALVLRRRHPDAPGYRAPALPLLVVVSTLFVAYAVTQIFFPGLGVHWFQGDFTPDGWTHHERWLYAMTELVPTALFLGVGVSFWAIGNRRRRRTTPVVGAA